MTGLMGRSLHRRRPERHSLVHTRGVLVLGCVMLFGCLTVTHAVAASKVTGTLLAKDALTVPNVPAKIEVRLVERRMMGETGLGGESLELEIASETVAKAMTGGDGRAFFEYTPRSRGSFTFSVRLADSPRVDASATTGLLAVWEYRRPILVVEASALIEESAGLPLTGLPLGRRSLGELKPASDAAEELSLLAKFNYHVIYIAAKGEGPFAAAPDDAFRQWLEEHHFPLGLIVHQRIDSDGLGGYLDQLKTDGWAAIRNGIGRTLAFADTLLERRLDVVLVPEPPSGKVPRKARIAKDWKDVRKRL